MDHLPQVRKSRFNDHNLGTSVQTWRKIYKIEQGGSFTLFMEVTVLIRGSTDFIEITRKHVFCDMLKVPIEPFSNFSNKFLTLQILLTNNTNLVKEV